VALLAHAGAANLGVGARAESGAVVEGFAVVATRRQQPDGERGTVREGEKIFEDFSCIPNLIGYCAV